VQSDPALGSDSEKSDLGSISFGLAPVPVKSQSNPTGTDANTQSPQVQASASPAPESVDAEAPAEPYVWKDPVERSKRRGLADGPTRLAMAELYQEHVRNHWMHLVDEGLIDAPIP
jgi:hypothetical protein